MIPLTNTETFLWGALGALVSFLVVFVLPEAVAVARGQKTVEITLMRLLGALLVGAIFIVAGGALSVAFGDATQGKQALAYGLGIEGIIGGTLKGII